MTEVQALISQIDQQLERSDRAFEADFPGQSTAWQPVHTAYVPADRYTASTVAEWRQQATDAVAAHGSNIELFARATGVDQDLVAQVYDRVTAKLLVEPIEDLRIDFEDGFGSHTDQVEDAAAVTAARALAQTVQDGTAPRMFGLRMRSLGPSTRHRGIRTLSLFLTELAARDSVGAGLVVTVPKVTSVEQVEASNTLLSHFEQTLGLAEGTFRLEIQVETPQSLIGADGVVVLPRLIRASHGRCTGLHFGTYDYSASCGIAAAYQSMEHPSADLAKGIMQIVAAEADVFVSDGSTNVLPVGDQSAVHNGWHTHARLVRRSLDRGFYQGWDLHPAQLPTRYLSTFAFYREGLRSAVKRLSDYASSTAGSVMDEPATAKALAGYAIRGVDCGAVDPDEVTEPTGLTWAEVEALARP